MNDKQKLSNHLEFKQRSPEKSPIKRLTRLLKTKIENAIQKGDYQTALIEVRNIKGDYHWVQCKEAEILYKMDRIQEAYDVCEGIIKKQKQCSQCIKLIDELSQQAEKESQFQNLTEVKISSSFRKNTLRSAQKNSPRETEISQTKNQFEQFLQYLKTNNCLFKNIQIVEEAPGYRVVRAKENIEKDDIVALIPEKLMITVDLAKQSKIGKQIEPILNELKSPKHTLLSLFLLEQEKKGKDSQFYYYLQILPKNLDNFPIFYSEKLLLELKNTFFFHILERKKQDLRDDFEKLRMRSAFARKITFQNFQRARMIISSRIFGIIINGSKTDALVPLADMLNHNYPKMTTWSYEDDHSAFIVKNIDGTIQKGEEIHDSYGCKCNSRFLLNYGFIQQRNPSNEVGIKLRDRENRNLHRMIRLTKDISSVEFDNLLGESRLMANKNTSQNEDDFSQLSHEFTTREAELEMWKYLLSEISFQLSLYPTTIKVMQIVIQTDQKILREKSLNFNYRNCVEIRLGQKQILQFYLNMAKSMITLFEGGRGNISLLEYRSYLRKIPSQRNLRSSD